MHKYVECEGLNLYLMVFILFEKCVRNMSVFLFLLISCIHVDIPYLGYGYRVLFVGLSYPFLGSSVQTLIIEIIDMFSRQSVLRCEVFTFLFWFV